MKTFQKDKNSQNKIIIGSTPNTTKNMSKYSPTKRGISSDHLRDVPNYLTNQYTPQNQNYENSLKSLITQAEQGKPPSTINFNTRNSIQTSSSRQIVTNDRISHSLSPKQNLRSNPKVFLPEKSKEHAGKKTLVLDLDETLVHSSFNTFDSPDITLNIELENKIHQIYVVVRPGAEEFLERMAKYYEIVIYTASLSKYADPLIDKLDAKRSCSFRLFREHCSYINNVYIKDLTKLGRNLKDLIIIDNTPTCFALQPENGVPIKSWYIDKGDRELYLQTPILEFLSNVYDIRDYLKRFISNNEVSYQQAWTMINSVKNDNSLTSHTNNNANNDKVVISNTLNPKQIIQSQNDDKVKSIITNPMKNNYISGGNTFKKPSTAYPASYGSGYNSNNPLQKPDNSNININIINNNINHYIINNPNDDPQNKDKKRPEDKRIKSFRSSYTNNNPSMDYNPTNNINPMNNTPTSPYNLDKKLVQKKPNEVQTTNNSNNSNQSNKFFINQIASSRQNNNSNSNLLANNPKLNSNIITTNNIKINPSILNNNPVSTSTNKNTHQRPSSAISLNVRHNRDRTINQNQTNSTIKEILNRKGSNNSILVNPISTGINISNLHRSDSTSSYSTKNKLTKTTFNNKLSIDNKLNNDMIDLTKNSRGNQSTRPSTDKFFKGPIYNQNDNNRRSNSTASKSIERKTTNSSGKYLKLEEQKYYDQDSIHLSKHSNSNSNLLNKNTFSINNNRTNSINSSNSNLQNYIKTREGQNTVKNSNMIANPGSSKNFGLLIQTEYKNKVRSPSNSGSNPNLLVSQILKERSNYENKNSNQFIKSETKNNLRLNMYS